jgi:5-methylthioribose kinase
MEKYGYLQHLKKINIKMKIGLPLDESVKTYLTEIGILKAAETIISTEIAGQGNMNVVLRITTSNDKSYILKQSRPFVQKYPQIPAPEERILTELAFYQAIKGNEIIESTSPEIIAFDKENYLIIMSDLGSAADLSSIYSNASSLKFEHLGQLLAYLNELHVIQVAEYEPNTGMKVLNHEHIFNFPFEKNNGFDLNNIQNGLAEIAEEYKNDEILKDVIGRLGEKYLGSGISLLHGDFYPGSFMDTKTGLKVIDPEFSFMGDREFDLGVLKAHLILTGSKFADSFLQKYTLEYDLNLVNKYAGVEILRRILGIAQLPLRLGLNRKYELCQTARNLILT